MDHFHHYPSVGFWSASAVSHKVEGESAIRNGLEHLQQEPAHSINSSARASRVGGHHDAEGIGSLEIDAQLVLRRLLDGQIGGSGTLEEMALAPYGLTAGPQESC